jgi:hypothetical protein
MGFGRYQTLSQVGQSLGVTFAERLRVGGFVRDGQRQLAAIGCKKHPFSVSPRAGVAL